MSIEEHPHVILYPVADPEITAIWPYMLRIPGGPNIALTQKDLRILYATCAGSLEAKRTDCKDCKWYINAHCEAWDQRGSSGICDLYEPRGGEE